MSEKHQNNNVEKQVNGETPATHVGRRGFLKVTVGGALLGVLGKEALAGELIPLKTDDPTAQALGYVTDASKLDDSTEGFVKGSDCTNCMHYKAVGETGNGSCALFPGKSVEGKAWCKVWVPNH